MAGQFELLFSVDFAAVDTVTVTHNLDRLQVGVIVRIGNVSRNDLIESITPLEGDPRNAVVVVLTGAQTGSILIADTDYVFANIPTPEGAIAAAVSSTDNTTTSDPTVNDDGTLGYVVGSRWINTTGPSEFVCSDATTGAAVWTLTTFSPPGAVYVDYYDSGTMDIGSSPTTLEMNTERQSSSKFVLGSNTVTVQAGGAGDYLVTYGVTGGEGDSSNRTIETWVEVDGSEVPASRGEFMHWDEHGATGDGTCGRSMILTLADGEVLRLRGEVTDGSSGMTTATGGVSLVIASIGANGATGSAGPQGPAGSGSTINVEDEGSGIPNTPHANLDFVGAGVTATDAGGGVATITIPGGSSANVAQYRQTANLTINTSATTVPLNATDFEDSNFTAAPLTGLITINTAGVYRISYNVYFDTNANARRTVDSWCEVNSVEIIPSRAASYSRNTTDDTASSGTAFLVQLAASDVVRLRCQSTGTNGTAIGQGNRMWLTLEFVRS